MAYFSLINISCKSKLGPKSSPVTFRNERLNQVAKKKWERKKTTIVSTNIFMKKSAVLLGRWWGKRKSCLLGFPDVNSIPQLQTPAKTIITKPDMAL